MYTFKSSRAFKCYYWFINSSCEKINVHINGQQGNKDNSLNCNNREVFNIQFIIIHSFYSTVNALMDFSEKNTTIVLFVLFVRKVYKSVLNSNMTKNKIINEDIVESLQGYNTYMRA